MIELPWTRQPDRPVRPRLSGPLAGAIILWSPRGPQAPINWATGLGVREVGPVLAAAYAAGSSQFTDLGPMPVLSAVTFGVIAQATTNNQFFLSSRSTSSTQGFEIAVGLGGVSGVMGTRTQSSGATLSTTGSSGLNDAQFHHYTGRFDSTKASMFIDGVKYSDASGTGGSITSSQNLYLARRGTTYLTGGIAFAYVIPRALGDGEIYALHSAPWLALEPRRIWVKASAAGVSGSLAYTNADDTLAASGATTVTGTLARTNANDTLAAAGTTTVVGTLGATNANDSLAASGVVGGDVTGTVDCTNQNDTLAAAGTTTVTGTLATTNANDTLAASGIADSVTGTVDYTNRDDTSQASGFVGDEPVQTGPTPAGSRKRRYYLPNGESVYATRREVEQILDELAEDTEVVEKAVEVLKTKDTKAAKVVLTKVVKYDLEELPKKVVKEVFEEITDDIELEAHAHWYINWERDLIMHALERLL